VFLGPFAVVKLVRLFVRLVVLLVLAIVIYLVVTGMQVWLASGRSYPVHAQAALVVGGSESGGVPSPALVARLEKAAGLLREGLVSSVVVTGSALGGHAHGTGEVSAAWLRSNGLPASAVAEVGGSGLWGEESAAASLLRQRSESQVLMVTDGYEEDRALAIASALGIEAEPVPANATGAGAPGFGQLVYETLAVGVGRVIGYGHLHELHRIFG